MFWSLLGIANPASGEAMLEIWLGVWARGSRVSTLCLHEVNSPTRFLSTSPMSFTLSCNCIMLRSCLWSVSDCGSSERLLHTLEAVRLCIDNQSCSLCRIDTVEPRHTFVCVFDSDYMPVWHEPVYAVLAVQLSSHTGPCTGLEHKSPGHMEQRRAVEVVDGKVARCCDV